MNPANGNSTSRAQDPPILSREDWTVPDNYNSITGPQDLPLLTWKGWWVRGLAPSDLERCRQIWSLAILQGSPESPCLPGRVWTDSATENSASGTQDQFLLLWVGSDSFHNWEIHQWVLEPTGLSQESVDGSPY